MNRNLASGSLFLSFLLVAGCQRAQEPEYVSSAEVMELSDELQQAVRDELTRVVGTPGAPKPFGEESTRAAEEHLIFGAEIYNRRCASCHGVTGDGAGPAAEYLKPKPRDYRRGMFKFTSTPYGGKPRKEDLIRTVKQGVQGTSMPSFDLLSDAELEAVVDYVLLLTHRGELETLVAFDADSEDEVDPELLDDNVAAILDQWASAEDEMVRPVTVMPKITSETVELGRATFKQRECFKCHGLDGRGGSVGNVEVGNDNWGNPNPAADLTSGMLHGGQEPLDIYRRIYSGINGTQMPEFRAAFAEEPDTVWHLVHYIMHLADQRRRGTWFLAGDTPTSLPADEPGAAPAGDADPAAEEPEAEAEPAAEEAPADAS